jgi:ribosomal protein S18 acetylase RimI-like enzyme
MAGYDGHRGWVYYFGVDPAHQREGHGRTLLAEVERMLLAEGCPKVNLQVRTANHEATAFYERVGYAVDDVRSLGKRLVPDGPTVR